MWPPCLHLALAWGIEGHHIAAEIAEQYLDPETARQVRELLAIENATTLAKVSTWAGDIRRQRPQTAPWHYVNIPIHPENGPSGYDAVRDCPDGDCVVASAVIISAGAAAAKVRRISAAGVSARKSATTAAVISTPCSDPSIGSAAGSSDCSHAHPLAHRKGSQTEKSSCRSCCGKCLRQPHTVQVD